jgi:hypothetical protein
VIRWPLHRSDFYPVPQYLMCPAGSRGVDDPLHQPSWGTETPPGEQPRPGLYDGPVNLPVRCVCGVRVTKDNAKRLDAF